MHLKFEQPVDDAIPSAGIPPAASNEPCVLQSVARDLSILGILTWGLRDPLLIAGAPVFGSENCVGPSITYSLHLSWFPGFQRTC